MKKKDLILTIILILTDRITKVLATKFINYLEVIDIIKNKFYLTYVTNTGSAFSLFEGKRWLLIIISLIVLYFLISYYKKLDEKASKISIILIISGLIGNLIDRVVFGKVIDFIGIVIFKYYFPIFNLADTYVVFGVIILIISMIGSDNSERINSRRRH